MNCCKCFPNTLAKSQIHSFPSPQVSLHSPALPAETPNHSSSLTSRTGKARQDLLRAGPDLHSLARDHLNHSLGLSLCHWQEFLWDSGCSRPCSAPAVKSESLENAHPSSSCVPVRELQSKQCWSPGDTETQSPVLLPSPNSQMSL